MNRTPVSSSSIASVGYESASMTLEVEFKGGRIYQYFDVPSAEYDNLMSAVSIGKYHCEHIRNSYRYAQV